jgi:hypothetical protein
MDRHLQERRSMESIQANVEKMEAQLEHWGTKLQALVTKAEAVGEDAKGEGRKRIDELASKHHAAKLRLDELKAAGAEKWDTLKVGVESAWHELETTFEKLTS